MLCQKCKQREANTHIVRTVGNNTVELYLCPECAKESGVTAEFNISNFLFSDILSSPFISFGEKKICPVCKTSFAEIQRSGNVGCGECYKIFANELQPTVSRLHSLPFHKGKIPKMHRKSEDQATVSENKTEQKSVKLTKDQKIEKLRSEQDEAIRAENFEKAAELRDMIRKLEGGKDE